METITQQATTDQQNGVPLTRGRDRYTGADRATYANAWLESMRVNGPAVAFARV